MGRSRVNLAGLEFPRSYMHEGVDLADQLRRLVVPAVEIWQKSGLVSSSMSLGLVVANPDYAGRFHQIWDKPKVLTGFAVEMGPENQLSLADALRMMRAAARTSCDTLVMRNDSNFGEIKFREQVVSLEDDGTMPWGDIAQGGACFAGEDDLQWLVGVAGLEEPQNDMVASMAARFLYGRQLQMSGLLE
jgi:hypothetical protein